MAKTYLQESGVSHIETQCICDHLTLHDAVSNNMCSRRHLAWQSYGKSFLFAIHDKATAKQYATTRCNLQWQSTSEDDWNIKVCDNCKNSEEIDIRLWTTFSYYWTFYQVFTLIGLVF